MLYFQKYYTSFVVLSIINLLLTGEFLCHITEDWRDLREDNDLTQSQLVEKLGMHKTTYTNYEQGKRDLPLSFAITIAKFYNVSLDYIAGLTNECRKLDENL